MAKRGPVAHYRLSRAEYGHTVYDLLGVYFDVDAPGAFNEDPRWHGFERIGSMLSLSPSHVERYFRAAETVLDRAFPERPTTAAKGRNEPKDGKRWLLFPGLSRGGADSATSESPLASSATSPQGRSTDALLRRGDRELQRGELETAKNMYRQVLSVKADHPVDQIGPVVEAALLPRFQDLRRNFGPHGGYRGQFRLGCGIDVNLPQHVAGLGGSNALAFGNA